MKLEADASVRRSVVRPHQDVASPGTTSVARLRASGVAVAHQAAVGCATGAGANGCW